MNTTVIEWAPFTLKEGIDEAKLLEAADALQKDFLSKQEGFLKRELLKGEGDKWVDILHWSSKEAAEKAMEHVMGSTVCQQYFHCMSNATEAPLLFQQAQSWD